jgi:hypothetical protein
MPDRGPQNPRRDKLIREHEHDPYHLDRKLPDPSACTECGVMYRAGRWHWGAPPVDAKPVLCPACHRIQDDYPAGVLTLTGDFTQEHRDEILNLARHVTERENGEHPLKRIMKIVEEPDTVRIATTDAGLARSIGDAIRHAYQGELEYRYPEEGGLLRVTWRR